MSLLSLSHCITVALYIVLRWIYLFNAFSFFFSALSSSDIPQFKDSSTKVAVTSKYSSIIGHSVSPAPTRVPTVVVVAALVAAFITALVMSLIHLVRKRY